MLMPQGGRAWRIAFGGLLIAASADAFAPAGGRLALPHSAARFSPAASVRKTVCMAGGGAALPDGMITLML